MAKLRSASAYRRIKRAYTRHSKRRAKSYVKGAPDIRIVHYDLGEKTRDFPYELQLIATDNIQIRDNALEAARQTAVRHMESVAKTDWSMKIRAVPHHILREKPLATGAGSDRFSQGMSMAFGKPYGHAAQVKRGKILISFFTIKEKLHIAKEAARKAAAKLPISRLIRTIECATGKEITA